MDDSFTLLTDRLRLRPLTLDDVDSLFTILGDAETMRWYPFLYERSDVVRWIESARDDYRGLGFSLLAVDERETGEFLGDCGPIIQHVDEEPHVELGWHFRRDRWGRGFAPEAAAACRDWCFGSLAIDHVIALIRPEHRQSRRVAEKIGMTVWRDTELYGLPNLVYRLDRA